MTYDWARTAPVTWNDKVRQLREAKGLSRRQLAKRADLDPKTILQIEERWTEDPKLSTIRKLSAALECDFLLLPKYWLREYE